MQILGEDVMAFMTWASHTHSHSIISVLYSMGHSIHIPGECMGREQSRFGIICFISRHFSDLFM